MNKELQLLDRLKSGDQSAVSAFIDQYQHFVYSIVFRIVKSRVFAEEVSQDVFIKAYNSLDQFHGNSKFSTWLYQIAYRKALDKLRSGEVKAKYKTDQLDLMAYNQSDDSRTDRALLQRDLKKMIRNTMDMLPPDEAGILTLFYFKELSVAEVAAIVGYSQENVKVKLFRARKKLKALLEKDPETEKLEMIRKNYLYDE